MKKGIFTGLFLLLFQFIAAQVNMDSLQQVRKDTSNSVINRCYALHDIAWSGYLYSNLDSSIRYSRLHLELAEKHGEAQQQADALNSIGVAYLFKSEYDRGLEYCFRALEIYKEDENYKGMASTMNNIGGLYKYKGDYQNALDAYRKSVKYDKKTGSNEGISATFNNMASIFKIRGDYKKAIQNYMKSLRMDEKAGYEQGIGASCYNIGTVYKRQGQYDKAEAYIRRSLKIKKKLNDKRGEGSAYTGLANIHTDLDELDEALAYHQKALEIREGMGDKHKMAITLANMGSIKQDQGKFDEARDYYSRAIKIHKSTGHKRFLAQVYHYMGELLYETGEHKKAIEYLLESLSLARKVGVAERMASVSETLYLVYNERQYFSRALEMYELHIKLRDSIKSEENQRELIRQEYKYEYEKKAYADSIKQAEEKKVADAKIAAQQARLKQEETQRYALYGGLGLLLVFGGFMYNRFRVTRKQRNIIQSQKTEVERQKNEAEHQKTIVEEKNNEILDSINYAKRLQEAILPPQKLVKQWLDQSFILYKPKDIVAGDFYWMETAGDTVYFAAADCTGHGVPGAMVSVVCSNALSKALIEENITAPGKILDRTRELVIERFGRSEEEIKDGMDISLCALNTKTSELQWAGANNPLWIINPERKEWPGNSKPFKKTEGGAEIKADKQPIGKYASEEPFANHRLELQKGDAIYMFSDGYPDQFGGEKGKKYKSGRMKKTLLSMYNEPMQKQKELLDKEFERWRGDLDQLDDVCVIGVRV